MLAARIRKSPTATALPQAHGHRRHDSGQSADLRDLGHLVMLCPGQALHGGSHQVTQRPALTSASDVALTTSSAKRCP